MAAFWMILVSFSVGIEKPPFLFLILFYTNPLGLSSIPPRRKCKSQDRERFQYCLQASAANTVCVSTKKTPKDHCIDLPELFCVSLTKKMQAQNCCGVRFFVADIFFSAPLRYIDSCKSQANKLGKFAFGRCPSCQNML